MPMGDNIREEEQAKVDGLQAVNRMLREQNRVLREVVDYIKQRCEPFQHGGDHGLKLHGGILPARIVAALTATSQEGQG